MGRPFLWLGSEPKSMFNSHHSLLRRAQRRSNPAQGQATLDCRASLAMTSDANFTQDDLEPVKEAVREGGVAQVADPAFELAVILTIYVCSYPAGDMQHLSPLLPLLHVSYTHMKKGRPLQSALSYLD
jgi:hypothetical protein